MMPGFTAEASLYVRQRRYAARGDIAISVPDAMVPASCWSYHGRCTGSGFGWSRQCVRAPTSQSPDADMVDQCCIGPHAFPWVEVCGDRYTSGCGFCFW